MLKNTKRFCAIMLALSILAASFAGCKSEDVNNKEQEQGKVTIGTNITNEDPLMGEGKNGKIKLEVWAPDAATKIFKKQCNQFIENMKDYGDIEIDVVPQGEADAATNILKDAESSADVFGFACDNLNKLVNAGSVFEIVGDDRTEVEEANSESSVEAAKIDGSLYAYPETGDNSYCLVYDKNVVSEDDTKTLEGVLKACKAANKKFVLNAESGYYACLFLFTGGVKLDGFEDDGETQKFNDYDEKTVIKTMMAFRSLFSAYKDIFFNGDVTKVVDGFKSGTVGAGFDGSWNFKSIKDTLGKRAGFAILPTINVDGEERQIINMFGYKLLGVNAFTKYPATSNELAKYLSSEECQKQRLEELNWGPSNKVVAESDLVKNDEAISAILAQSENSVPQINIASTFWSPLKTFGNKIVDFNNSLTEKDCEELLHRTIANIRDE